MKWLIGAGISMLFFGQLGGFLLGIIVMYLYTKKHDDFNYRTAEAREELTFSADDVSYPLEKFKVVPKNRTN